MEVLNRAAGQQERTKNKETNLSKLPAGTWQLLVELKGGLLQLQVFVALKDTGDKIEFVEQRKEEDQHLVGRRYVLHLCRTLRQVVVGDLGPVDVAVLVAGLHVRVVLQEERDRSEEIEHLHEEERYQVGRLAAGHAVDEQRRDEQLQRLGDDVEHDQLVGLEARIQVGRIGIFFVQIEVDRELGQQNQDVHEAHDLFGREKENAVRG